jgi:phosphotriesterase-related protein
MPQVMTVRGPLLADALGFTLPHEHTFLNLAAFPTSATLSGLDAIIDPVRHTQILIDELALFKELGGVSLVDLTNRNMGGDVEATRRLSEATGINIIYGCGWYREAFMDEFLYWKPTDELAEELTFEIEHGFGDTGIRPGIIGEIGTNLLHLSAKEERCLRAMAKAQRRTGLALTTHLPQGGVGLELLDIVQEHGVPADRVIIGHADVYMDVDYHVSLMKRGAYVEFDNIGAHHFDPPRQEPVLVEHIFQLIQAGYVERILLSHDTCWRSRLAYWGGPGYVYLFHTFLPLLRARGVSDEAIHTMTVVNPQRVLAV